MILMMPVVTAMLEVLIVSLDLLHFDMFATMFLLVVFLNCSFGLVQWFDSTWISNLDSCISSSFSDSFSIVFFVCLSEFFSVNVHWILCFAVARFACFGSLS